jgi:DinB superfamily
MSPWSVTVQSRDFIRGNLARSLDRVLERIDEMREHSVVFPTPNGGCHTLWVLGHLAYIEAQVIRQFMLGGSNPLADWEQIFDGPDPSGDAEHYPSFERVLATCRETRQFTMALLDSLTEDDLDKASASVPGGWEDTFGTYRLCLQFVADHWYMHRGHLADARRAAGLKRMWV